MRAYWLHNASWSRIVTHRVQRPDAIIDRLTSRRRPARPVPVDGQLVLLACNHNRDPRNGLPVSRRELLDRIVEALSVSEVDGVIGSADLLEELTLLNVLEHRLAFCSAAGPCGGVGSTTIAASQFDGAVLSHRWPTLPDASAKAPFVTGTKPWCVAADVAEAAAQDLPTILDVSLSHEGGRAEFDISWDQWIDPITAAAAAIATGPGVWMTIPAIAGLGHVAEATGFPILVRDTEVPISPSAWQQFFETELPMTVCGMVPGASVLFPLEGSVAEASATIAKAIRRRGRDGRKAA